MIQRVIKFRRAYFNYDGSFYGFKMWGPNIEGGDGFISPSYIHGCKSGADQQFTSLTDKHGKEIYDGDLISDGTNTWEVRFIDGCFWLYRKGFNAASSMRSWPEDCYPMFRVNHSLYSEIIGNIYTNPELIER